MGTVWARVKGQGHSDLQKGGGGVGSIAVLQLDILFKGVLIKVYNLQMVSVWAHLKFIAL